MPKPGRSIRLFYAVALLQGRGDQPPTLGGGGLYPACMARFHFVFGCFCACIVLLG